jgi:filamentous hemagglutinin family protein
LIPLLVAWGAVLANGSIVTDGTVGTTGHLGAPQTFSGSDVKITQDMGTTAGHNVFQSFNEFNIGSGQTVTFTENSTNFVNNIIARVTGKDTSNINGTLQVTPGGHANFYLLNPNGVMFGNGAHIDVPGDFHVTTAHFIKFQDGAKYGADPVHSHLSTTEPASFGFSSGTHSNNILIDVTDGAQLKNPTTPNTAIDLVAQNIKIENGATVSANDVRLVAAKGNMSVSLSNDVYGNLLLPKLAPTSANAGKVQIIGYGDDNSANVTSRTDGGGRIAVWGGVDVTNGGAINSIQTGSSSPSSGNGITIKASNLRIESSGAIETTIDSNPSANASSIFISSVNNIRIISGGYLVSGASLGLRAGGSITIDGSDTFVSAMTNTSAAIADIAAGKDITVSNSSTIEINGLGEVQEGGRSSILRLSAESINVGGSARIDNSGGLHPLLYMTALKGIALSGGSSVDSFNELGGGGDIFIYNGGGLLLQGDSQIWSLNGLSSSNSIGFNGGFISVHSEYIFMDKGSILTSTSGSGATLKLDGVQAIFPFDNKLNGQQYPGQVGRPKIEGGIPKYNGGEYFGNKNSIAALSHGLGDNVVLSGPLLNLSGDMASLPPANFKSKEIPNSCEAANTGSLSLSGKGRTSLNALDRVIYGY